MLGLSLSIFVPTTGRQAAPVVTAVSLDFSKSANTFYVPILGL